MVKIKMTPVISSNLTAVGYDESSKTLRVTFVEKRKGKVGPGNTYDYNPVPGNIHKEMMAAESLGKYFHTNIRTNESYTFTKIQ